MEKNPINKTTIFYTPLQNKDIFVKTGVCSGNLSLLHAILHAIDKNYATCDQRKKDKLVKKLLLKIQGVTMFKKELYNFFKCIEITPTKALKKYPDFIETKNDVEIFKIFCEIVPLRDIESKEVYDKDLDIFKKNIVNLCNKKINITEREKKNKFIKKVSNMLEFLIHKIDENEDDIEDENFDLVKNISQISQTINKNIFIFNLETRLPFLLFKNRQDYKKQDSVVLLKIKNDFEVLGKVKKNDEVQRVFEYNDHFVQRMILYLYDQDLLYENYPFMKEHSTSIKSVQGIDTFSWQKSPQGSPRGSPKGSPKKPKKSPSYGSPKGSPNGSPKGSPNGSPKGSPSNSPPPFPFRFKNPKTPLFRFDSD